MWCNSIVNEGDLPSLTINIRSPSLSIGSDHLPIITVGRINVTVSTTWQTTEIVSFYSDQSSIKYPDMSRPQLADEIWHFLITVQTTLYVHGEVSPQLISKDFLKGVVGMVNNWELSQIQAHCRLPLPFRRPGNVNSITECEQFKFERVQNSLKYNWLKHWYLNVNLISWFILHIVGCMEDICLFATN